MWLVSRLFNFNLTALVAYHSHGDISYTMAIIQICNYESGLEAIDQDSGSFISIGCTPSIVMNIRVLKWV